MNRIYRIFFCPHAGSLRAENQLLTQYEELSFIAEEAIAFFLAGFRPAKKRS